MKKNIPTIIVLLLAGVVTLGSISSAKAQSDNDLIFNPNNIISNNELMDVNSMSLFDIQSFLQEKGSYLASYQTNNAYGVLKSAAEIIYDASLNNYNCDGVTLSEAPTAEERALKCRTITTINPKALLVLLQKEQSLIQNPSPTQKALDEATGYGCPTGQTCTPYWKGFGKQVNSAALQFLSYMHEANKYNFKVGTTYIAKDRYTMLKSVEKAVKDGSYNSIVTSPNFVNITIENQATASLYIYTPHIYNGNYNFFNLYNKYFSEGIDSPSLPTVLPKIYPDGSILKIAGSPGIWLIENEVKRPFLNYSSFISRFSESQIITTKQSVLDAYPVGEGIKFPDYSLVQIPDDTIYLLVGSEKRSFDSLATFKAIGFHESEVEQATNTELLGYNIGQSITATSTYVTGALLQDITTGGVYYVENGTKAPLLDKVFLETKYKDEYIMRVSPEILNTYTKVAPILFLDGTLLKSSSSPAVYLISKGAKRAFSSGDVFINLGYKFSNVINVSSQVLYHYPLGEPIQ
ncbi:MAG TPA: hypothetical protein VFD51_01330 [Patescibacteria group bacterium]|nr:hypothetical protein [Patescibacteria group bacterium]